MLTTNVPSAILILIAKVDFLSPSGTKSLSFCNLFLMKNGEDPMISSPSNEVISDIIVVQDCIRLIIHV